MRLGVRCQYKTTFHMKLPMTANRIINRPNIGTGNCVTTIAAVTWIASNIVAIKRDGRMLTARGAPQGFDDMQLLGRAGAITAHDVGQQHGIG